MQTSAKKVDGLSGAIGTVRETVLRMQSDLQGLYARIRGYAVLKELRQARLGSEWTLSYSARQTEKWSLKMRRSTPTQTNQDELGRRGFHNAWRDERHCRKHTF